MLDLSNARFAFLDIETTGLSPWFGDRICQVAIVVSEGKRIRQTFDSVVNPEQPLSPAECVNDLRHEISEFSHFHERLLQPKFG